MEPPTNRISLKMLMYVRYSHPDIENADKFLTDFGLIATKKTPGRIWYRGFGASPVCYISEKSKDDQSAFFGGGWAVDTYKDLEVAAQLPGASPITGADDAIGGKAVTIQAEEEPKKLVYNTWDTKRRKGEFQRFEDGPSHIHKLGHYGFEVNYSEFEEVRQWYFDIFTLGHVGTLLHRQPRRATPITPHLDQSNGANLPRLLW
ncbi:hypothetical protein F4779DRAFT_619402 [Xylariaceae sp. FL0662B]|nr:hypothetical protein F4779DRAFT_619402 [Xylariaceae sp. FL0662B]